MAEIVVDSRAGDRALPRDPSLVGWTHSIYALHAISVLFGVFGAVTIVTAFLCGPLSILAVILNYVKRADVRGTYLDSHFSWQIRTFWYAVLWASIGMLVWIVLSVVLIGFVLGPAIIGLTGIWVAYRVIRGWLALRNGDPVPA